MRTAAYKVDVASDRRRRKNVPRHILCSVSNEITCTLRNFNSMHLQKFPRNLRKVPVFADNKSTHKIKIFIGNIFDAHILNFTYVLFRQGD